MTTDLSGVLTALATPFDQDEQIDVPVLKRLVDRSIAGGVDGVVAGGSTGEFASLSSEERILLVDTVVQHAAGRVPVVAQTGATTTREAIRLSRAAEASGADVLMLVTPYYEALSLDETIAYLREVIAAVELPVMLYNIPAATGVNLDADTIGSLAREIDQVEYVKDSSANWEQGLQLIHHHADAVKTFIGWDSYTFSALAEGAAGVMAGAANVVPAEIVAVSRAVAAGDLDGALAQWKRVYPVVDSLLSAPFIAAVKAGLRLQGEPAGVPRSPLAGLTPEAERRIELALAGLA
ncbi:4-hydroxy-tetrahydrodipicolinate synthase [Rathayibacter sp. VKM Ac-2759]|uniref:4-hydroxy-tetrahydrodipicolinate synthase n=1 Tax=Rathayibacter sp. VKM Ac-2759 TaxID=2609252 RepID=UPI001315EA0B|nr:4-hydroxy-tetrahydrodipicolinate synthase [Rathayibacter sp. VKM Ac-2759]QHC68054.1 4-hydroxy-tetrahydrodipicolinate synthase [Rathayibacter sp. VKM Ac-2759]